MKSKAGARADKRHVVQRTRIDMCSSNREKEAEIDIERLPRRRVLAREGGVGAETIKLLRGPTGESVREYA